MLINDAGSSGDCGRNGGRTVLLVEDEPFVREATTRIFESAGFQVFPAGDAQEAIRVYEMKQASVDLLMSDLGLPDRSGKQLGIDIRQRSSSLPILLTSGYLVGEEDDIAIDDKTYYLQKPYSKAMLLEKVHQILGSHRLHKAAQAV